MVDSLVIIEGNATQVFSQADFKGVHKDKDSVLLDEIRNTGSVDLPTSILHCRALSQIFYPPSLADPTEARL